MPQLGNHKHEKFAQAIALGHTQVEAYKKAGYRSDSRSAPSSLARRPDVAARIEELNADRRIVEETTRLHRAKVIAEGFDPNVISRDWVIAELMKNLDLAREHGKMKDANDAVELLARLAGIIKEDDGPKRKDPNRDQPRPQVAVQIINQGGGSGADGDRDGDPAGTAITLDGTRAITDGRPEHSDDLVAGLARFFADRVSGAPADRGSEEPELLRGVHDAGGTAGSAPRVDGGETGSD